MPLYQQTIPQFRKMLGQLDAWLDKATVFAASRDMDPELLLNARLYPDQFTLRRNIQAACDIPKLAAARLAGVEAPTHEDTEQTLDQLEARIRSVQAFLDTVPESAIDASTATVIAPKVFRGKAMLGEAYVTEFAAPNFYFHLTTAYSILRHCGVKLGKLDFLGSLTLVDPS